MNIENLGVPDKSENDKKEYKVIRLRNGITALIVSDPSPLPIEGEDDDDNIDGLNYAGSGDSGDTDDDSSHGGYSRASSPSIASTSTEGKSSAYSDDSEGDEKLAACGLLVTVGSFSDPPDIQGLAHFLEHMIFMGSEKYPKENEFDSYIKKCGGFDNAHTDDEETSFHFEVPDEHLEQAMDRFTSLFKKPLMKREGMTRERESVDSEFHTTLQADESRRDQLIAALANQSHPCSVFAWGNSKTLKDNIDDRILHTRVIEFQKRHYSSHRMFCAVQARLPLEQIEKLVIKYFSGLKNNNLPEIDFSEFNHRNAFPPDFFDNVYFIKPVANVNKIEFTWCMPSLVREYKCKPHQYLAYLFGYEGVGSLCGYLRSKLWALEMIAGIPDSGFDNNSMFSLFNVCIYLTEDGFDHMDEVLAATYSYIKLFEHVGPDKKLFDELKHIEETEFRYRSERSAYDNVQDYLVNLKYYPIKDLLTGPLLYFEYDEEAIGKLIQFINTEKCNIMISASKTYPGIVYDKTEKWFGSSYTSMPMPQKWIDLWKNAKLLPDLHFPDKNKFVPTDFRIWLKENDPGAESLILPSSYPKKIMDSDICELWYRQDDKFMLPEAYLYFHFISPLSQQSLKSSTLLGLYVLIIRYNLVEVLYPATVAGFNYQIYPHEKGISLKINGYNEKIHFIIDVISKAMTTLPDLVTEETLHIFISQMQKNYYNSLIKPKNLNKEVRLAIVENIRWPMYEKYSLISTITLEDIKTFGRDLLKEMRIQALVQGNVTEETAHNIMNSILTNFNCTRIEDLEVIKPRTCEIPNGSNYILLQSLNKNDINTFVCNFYQIGPCTLINECLLELLMMLVEEPLFDILRTKEQLAYDVSASVRNNFGILAYTITVNSQEDKFDCSHVDDRIEAFRIKMMQLLREIDTTEFNLNKESLIKSKQVADLELIEEVDRNWNEIVNQEYIFDRLRREIEYIRTITKSDILHFCKETEKNNFRKLSIQIVGNKTGPPVADMPTEPTDDLKLDDLLGSGDIQLMSGGKSTISNLKEFKEKLNVYPVTKTEMNFPTPIDSTPDLIE